MTDDPSIKRRRDLEEVMRQRIASTDPPNISALESELGAISHAGARAIARRAGRADARAADVLSRGGPAVGLSLLAEPLPEAAEARGWVLRAAANAASSVRGSAVERLRSLLADKDVLRGVAQNRGPSEAARPPCRVCDIAFIGMRRILLAGRDPSERGRLDGAFLDLPEEVRDRVIASTLAKGFKNVRPDEDPGS